MFGELFRQVLATISHIVASVNKSSCRRSDGIELRRLCVCEQLFCVCLHMCVSVCAGSIKCGTKSEQERPSRHTDVHLKHMTVWNTFYMDLQTLFKQRHFKQRHTKQSPAFILKSIFWVRFSPSLPLPQSQRLTNTWTYTPVWSSKRDGKRSREAKPQPSINSQYGASFSKQNLPARNR